MLRTRAAATKPVLRRGHLPVDGILAWLAIRDALEKYCVQPAIAGLSDLRDLQARCEAQP